MADELDIQQIREYFKGDQFATKCLGAYVESFEDGVAIVSMVLDDRHHNAQGFVMGGVVMGLADFCLAVASNAGQTPGASVNHSCDIMNRARGEKLIATCRPDKIGRSLCFYKVDVHDELGNHVARMSATVARTPNVKPTPDAK